MTSILDYFGVGEPCVQLSNPAPMPMLCYTDDGMVTRRQVRFPRSKRKRVRKKWAADERNWETTPRADWYVSGGAIVCHPKMVRALAAVFPEMRFA